MLVYFFAKLFVSPPLEEEITAPAVHVDIKDFFCNILLALVLLWEKPRGAKPRI